MLNYCLPLRRFDIRPNRSFSLSLSLTLSLSPSLPPSPSWSQENKCHSFLYLLCGHHNLYPHLPINKYVSFICLCFVNIIEFPSAGTSVRLLPFWILACWRPRWLIRFVVASKASINTYMNTNIRTCPKFQLKT